MGWYVNCYVHCIRLEKKKICVLGTREDCETQFMGDIVTSTSIVATDARGQDLRGVLFLVAAACMWGILGPLSKLALAEGVGALEIAFWRAAFGAVLFGVHAVYTRQHRIASSDVLSLVLFGFIGVTVFYGSYQLAIQSVGAALAAVLLYTSPAWVGLLSWLVLREQMNAIKCASIGMTIAGAIFVCLPSGTGQMFVSPLGIIAGLLAGFSYALYYIFGKRLLASYASCTVFFYALVVGAVFLLPFVDFSHKTPAAWGYLFAIAVIASYGAFSAYSAGLRYMEASRAVVIATLEPVVAVSVSCVFFGESLSLLGWLGCAFILGAVLLVVSRAPQG